MLYILHIHTHTHTPEYYLAVKKEILPFATEIDFEGIVLSEISQKEKDKHCMVSVTCKI